MSVEKYWTRKRILASIKEWHTIHDHVPYSTDWFSSGGERVNGHVRWPSTSIVQREFGSWSEAIRQAGFKSPPRRTKRKVKSKPRAPMGYWTEEKIILLVQEWAEEHGLPPATNEWRGKAPVYPDVSTVVRLFGTWNTMIRAAGLVPRPKGLTSKAMSRYLPIPRKTKEEEVESG